ncbi:MAG: hypothetical protein A3I61_19755 [Acidobacteria bacterium RIFCSPLOWO2_02_FULL_68_18]|nr:MAG: hypothetical protein A3I61_19755 [Acidobacteria bacterium RIFCSPLOWO2_02_FULL_68_18]OFW48299.1 MAG: hypothetical protein A3G77_03380 [Acidobacteria bacterium RIFCSPLOWO2_12_FULL_68_19]
MSRRQPLASDLALETVEAAGRLQPDRVQRRDIICFSSIDWDFNWQGHQEVMSRLAGEGHRVLFVENTGVRAPSVRDLGRMVQRVRNWWRGLRGFRQVAERIYVYSPLVVPFPNSHLAEWINRGIVGGAMRRWMHAAGFHDPVVWVFLPTALVVDMIDDLDPLLVVYYCIADWEKLAPSPRSVRRSERRVLERADVVFVQGEELRRRCQPHPNIRIFPFGVRLEHFHEDVPVDPELSGLPRPLAGYVGGLHRHVDFDLLERLAGSWPGTIVLIGPEQAAIDRLQARPNVVLLGQQPHERLAGLIKGFDVGLIPYALNEYTRTVYPTKLNEYLALGIPVVSTALPDVRQFARDHGPVVTVAETPDAFVASVFQALEQTTPDLRRLRIRAAAANGWDRRVAEMWRIVEEGFATRVGHETPWDERLRRLYRRTSRRMVQVGGGLLASYILLFQTTAFWLLAEPLRLAAEPRAADVVVVFGSGVGESGKAGGGYQERLRKALDLYETGHAPRMIFSSGYVFAFPEAYVMRDVALGLGVPASDIILETKAANTRDNVEFVSTILRERGWRRILLVSSPYHMRRAMLTWRKLSRDVVVIPSPVPNSQFYAHERGPTLEQVRGIAHEYVAILAYWWRGWI